MDFMSVREFLRGGYKTLRGPTVISNHGAPLFTVLPYGSKAKEVPYIREDLWMKPDEPVAKKG
jgi:hypothetical protein